MDENGYFHVKTPKSDVIEKRDQMFTDVSIDIHDVLLKHNFLTLRCIFLVVIKMNIKVAALTFKRL